MPRTLSDRPYNSSVYRRLTRKSLRHSALPLLLAITLFIPLTGHGEMLRYLDEHGTPVFVDDRDLSPAERQEYQRKTRAARQARSRSGITPVEVHDNMVLVPVEISDGSNRITVRLLLDTGASHTVLHRHTMAYLHTQRLARGWSRLASGERIATDQVRLDDLKVGPHTVHKPTLYVIEVQDSKAPFDGLLGMDFLRAHPYRIDFRKQVIYWQNQK